MVKITIKKQDLGGSGSEDSDEAESDEGSDVESVGSGRSRDSNSAAVTSSGRGAGGRSKRKCVVNFERKKAKTLRPSKSRSKSVSPQDDVEERQPKQMFSCEICSKAFHSKFMMRTHLKAHKKVEQSNKCDRYYHYYLNSLN